MHSNLRQGDDQKMAALVADMNAGSVGVLLINNCNPAYSYPDAAAFAAGLKKVGTSVSFSMYEDETSKMCGYILPDTHFLES